ncbi:DUF4258 domain-containing protein [Puniceibacterium sp. IMCC21224]|uniref:DUF4258 domain-containing protein n=1 Tax=Puniceibacterium sp. IMCC21224 TaxID=1618204 RepID=UPI00065D5178|nr:DUF4258 domain-containing protein [Puniceibacterium sp. IMCC21224]KMK66006.1 protein of unknown function (DUF4258) [Puniceibacterium sp. IMCC21224]
MADAVTMPFRLTRHAERRANQRGINRETIETLLAFGAAQQAHGAEKVFMNRAARTKAKKELGRAKYAQIERDLDAYLVVDGETIVTVGHRTRAIRT